MKTVRFATIVEKFGQPEAHLVLTDPAKDQTLQEAIDSDRIMTVFQQTVGTKADQGVAGFKPGSARQFLIFPKPLRGLSDTKIVGIKYDLWKIKEIPKSQRATPSRQPKRPKARASKKLHEEAAAPSKFIVFENDNRGAEENETVAAIKKKVRRAMKVLEQGKAVAAFNLLKEIVRD